MMKKVGKRMAIRLRLKKDILFPKFLKGELDCIIHFARLCPVVSIFLDKRIYFVNNVQELASSFVIN
jgi:hypothetical protein